MWAGSHNQGYVKRGSQTDKYKTRSVGAGVFYWCARHVKHLGGESPLRAVMAGTASLSKGAHREVGSEGS